MSPKLSSNVSVVKINDQLIEFFLTNTRRQIRLKVEDDTIMNIVLSMDGIKTAQELAESYNVSIETLEKLISYLQSKGILDNVMPKTDIKSYERFRRTVHFLAEYTSSHEDMIELWNNINDSTVLIVGMGAVGSWVACNLAQSGVGKLIIMDGDEVDASNLHRQFSYCEADIGKKKVDALEKRLKEYNPDMRVQKSYDFLDDTSLKQFDDEKIDLIINCADKPNVDTTSLWIGEYAMNRGIPHIIGGGYNLHLSLIGQTVLPGKSACVKCFQKQLEEDNRIDPEKVKKLIVRNRKVGSFGPMCSMIASMVGMEAIKVLSKKIQPSNINRRGEFDIYTMDITYKEFARRDDCEWCGKDGKYYS